MFRSSSTSTSLLFSLPLILLSSTCLISAVVVTVDLKTANNYAVLATSTVTNTGPSVLDGWLGLFSGSSITGFPPGIINGFQNLANGAAQQALLDAGQAYTDAAANSPTQDLTGQDLGGKTLTPGVYFFSSSAQLTGQLTLNFQGNVNARFIFQIGSTLTTASASSVVYSNTGSSTSVPCNVFWQVGSSATLGTTTDFSGVILAHDSITLDTGADIDDGAAFALNGAVTLDDNDISTCSAAASALGDPQFTGFLGQQYQIHGRPDEIFSIISAEDLQVNAKFVYLNHGTCTYNNTQCYTHPGTYFGAFGLLVRSSSSNATEFRVELTSGAHVHGLTLRINDHVIPYPGHGVDSISHRLVISLGPDHTLTWSSYDCITLQTPEVTLTFTNSDFFFNIDASLVHRHGHEQIHHRDEQIPTFMHGLLGQTWRIRGQSQVHAKHKHQQFTVEGEIDDYIVADLFETPAVFNLYK